jgi:hypothetical protein
MRRLFLNRSEPAKKSGQNIPKNRCRTTIAEQMVETRAELPFIGDQVVCLSHEPGRPQRNAIPNWDKLGRRCPNAGYEPHPSCCDCPLTGSEPAKKSGQNIPKNRCRTTIAERMVETRAELPFIGDQTVCLSHSGLARKRGESAPYFACGSKSSARRGRSSGRSKSTECWRSQRYRPSAGTLAGSRQIPSARWEGAHPVEAQ